MQKGIKTSLIKIIIYFFNFLSYQLKFLFIVGHWRSRSTLLTHILNSNQECCAAGEAYIDYASKKGFTKLALKNIYKHRLLAITNKYFIDACLSNKYTPPQHLLIRPNVKTIFLVRPPEEAVKSFIELTEKYNDKWAEEKAISYYNERLEFLIDLKKTCPEMAILSLIQINSFKKPIKFWSS